MSSPPSTDSPRTDAARGLRFAVVTLLAIAAAALAAHLVDDSTLGAGVAAGLTAGTVASLGLRWVNGVRSQ